jgi:hypothetical protein
MKPKPEWLDKYERAYPSGSVAKYVSRPPKPDSYTMFTRLMEVVQEHQDTINKQNRQIRELTDRVKALEIKL